MCISRTADNGNAAFIQCNVFVITISIYRRRRHFGIQPFFFYKHVGVFANGHAVYYWHSLHAHMRSVGKVKHRSIHIKTIGIGTVEHYYRLAISNSRFDIFLQRSKIGVKPYTNILHIKQQDIHIFQILRRGFGFAAIKGDNRNTGGLICITAYFLSGIRRTPEAMLGGKYFYGNDAKLFKRIHKMGMPYYGGLVGKQCDRPAFDQRKILIKPVCPGKYIFRRLLFIRNRLYIFSDRHPLLAGQQRQD